LRHGVAVWSSARWRQTALEWLDREFAASGRERSSEFASERVRPWAAVFEVPTSAATLWFKACGPGTAFEVGLYGLLARVAPDRALTPIAADPKRGWIVLPDGGPSLGERPPGAERAQLLTEALVEYGRLQRRLEPHVDEMLELGVADMRPTAMPGRFDQALAALARASEADGDAEGREVLERVAAIESRVGRWCERLAGSPLPASLDHNDLHPWNVLGAGTGATRYYDWGDSVIAHPFATALVTLGFVRRDLGACLDDARFLRARDAYLEVFTDVASRAELAETLELACRVAKIARVLTWERALGAAREQGEDLDPQWSDAVREGVRSIPEESWLGRV